MSKPLNAIISIAVMTLGLTHSATVFAQTVDFTATAVQSMPNQPEQTGLIAKSGQNMRFEYEQNGQQLIKILRPTEGIILILDPNTQTYMEFNGPIIPATAIDEHPTPCPTENDGPRCERIGSDVTISGVQAERWLIGYPQQQPQVILWDPERRRALRQENPDGSLMQMTFQAMEDIDGRAVEHWTISLTSPTQAALSGDWWFAPDLRVVVQENLPDGQTRRLENIDISPVDPAMFAAPEGWQQQNIPAQSE